MNTLLIAVIIFACLFGAVLVGMRLRPLLPENHLGADTTGGAVSQFVK